jgi:hypothetical protein
MKNKIIIGVCVFAIIIAIGFNINSALNVSVVDITLSTEAEANGEGSSHGHPLMQSSSGAYKCANCSGNDCGAAC